MTWTSPQQETKTARTKRFGLGVRTRNQRHKALKTGWEPEGTKFRLITGLPKRIKHKLAEKREMNRPNKIECLDTDMGVIVAEALRLSGVLNCRVHQESGHYCIQRGKGHVHVHLDADTTVKMSFNNMTLDGRIGKEFWDLVKCYSSDGSGDYVKFLLADPNSVKTMAKVFRAIKPCWR